MLDEPTAALGVAQTAEVLNLIERVRERGLSVIIISHNMEDVRAVADRRSWLRLAQQRIFSRPMLPNQDLVAAITGDGKAPSHAGLNVNHSQRLPERCNFMNSKTASHTALTAA